MGRPKRLYPLGKFRLRVPKQPERDKAYPVELEYTWNRQILGRTTNVFVKVGDRNQAGNNGRGVIRSSYGPEYAHMNQILNGRVEGWGLCCCRRIYGHSWDGNPPDLLPTHDNNTDTYSCSNGFTLMFPMQSLQQAIKSDILS